MRKLHELIMLGLVFPFFYLPFDYVLSYGLGVKEPTYTHWYEYFIVHYLSLGTILLLYMIGKMIGNKIKRGE